MLSHTDPLACKNFQGLSFIWTFWETTELILFALLSCKEIQLSQLYIKHVTVFHCFNKYIPLKLHKLWKIIDNMLIIVML